MLSDLKKTAVLISDRTNPILDRSRAAEFSGKRRQFLRALAFASSAAAGLAAACVFAFFLPEQDWPKLLVCLSVVCLCRSALSAAASFGGMLAAKKDEYARKLIRTTNMLQDAYPVAVIKFGAAFPGLPSPDEKKYTAASSAYSKELRLVAKLKQCLSKTAYAKVASSCSTLFELSRLAG